MEQFYPVLNIGSQSEVLEALGTKEKFWLTYNHELCLLKFGRENTGEDWAEKVACELCRLLDLPHAEYDLALHNGRKCTLSKSFMAPDERLILGNELINRSTKSDDETRSYLQREHTVSRALAAVITFTELTGDLKPQGLSVNSTAFSASWHDFIGYLMLDAWIGNSDRHNENWGLILDRNGKRRLAPTFDHASSLGRELSDDKRAERLSTKDKRYTVAAYAEKGRSALFAKQSDTKPLSSFEAFATAARVQKESASYWINKLTKINLFDLNLIIDRIPPNFMSEIAREFAKRILIYNRDRIIRLLKSS